MPFAIRSKRLTIIDYPFPVIGRTFLSILSSPKYYPRSNLFQIFQCFPIPTWLLIFISFISLCCVNIIANDLKNKFHLFIDYNGILLRQAIIIKNYHSKYLIIMALFSSLFIFNFFGVDLIALETAQPILKIDSLDQLRRMENINLIVKNESKSQKMLLNYHKEFESRLELSK